MVYTLVGVVLPSSSAAATVITFPVDPGSYTSWTAGLRISANVILARLEGLKLGALACARIAPVFGSITMTVPDNALELFTAAVIASCATH